MMKQWIIVGLLFGMLAACTGASALAPAPAATAEEATSVLVSDTPTLEPATETPTATATMTPEPTATATPAAYGPDNFPAQVNPLTGQEVGDITLLERRPLAVKVQMFPRGQRPPSGISLADIVYDFYQNNGVTRLHAIFYSRNAEVVGPIRSARLLDIDLVHMYKSIFAFGSAESRTFQRLYNADFANRLVIEGYAKCPPMCRTDPNGYNFLVTNTQDLSSYVTSSGVDNLRQNLDGMSFAATIPPGGFAGSQVFVRYSISAYVRWDYDPGSGRYLRFQDAAEAADIDSEVYDPLMDGLTGAQIAAENVVVLLAPHKFAFGSNAGQGEVLDITLAGTGKAYAFRNGQVFDVIWNRPEKTSVLYLTFPDGSPYAFKPGSTWYHVVGKSSSISNVGENAVRFILAVP